MEVSNSLGVRIRSEDQLLGNLTAAAERGLPNLEWWWVNRRVNQALWIRSLS